MIQQSKVRPTDPVDNSFGQAVAIDGDTAVIGIQAGVFSVPSGEPIGAGGAAYVFGWNGAQWVFQARLQPSDGVAKKSFGTSVAISGNTIVVGAYADSTVALQNGSAYVFVGSGSSWTQTAKLEAHDATQRDNFGWSVAIDGDNILIGAPGHDLPGRADAGAVYLFQGVGPSLGTKFTATTDFALGRDLDADQGTFIAGTASRPAYIYRFVGAAFTQIARLVPTTGDGGGGGVAVHGNTALLGSPSEKIGTTGFRQGAAYLFTEQGGSWSQVSRFTASDGVAGDEFGHDVALCSGTHALVGVPSHNVGTTAVKEGAAYAFDQGPSGWQPNQTQGELVLAPDAGLGEKDDSPGFAWEAFGWSTACSGNTLLVSAYSDTDDTGTNSRQGAAYFLTRTADLGPPGAPTNVGATVSGNTVSLTWGAPTSGAAATGYTLLGRLTPGGPVVATLPMGAGSSFNVAAPDGTFVLTVRAENGSGTGPESAAVTVTVPQAVAPPGPPGNLTASVSGSTVSFTWNAPSSGGAVGSYVLVAGLTPGFSVPYTIVPLGATPGFAVSAVPAGTYYVRVLAQNTGGTSAPSNEVTLTVAGLTAPSAPTLNTPIVNGSTVILSWNSGGGGAPTSYTLVASATPGGAPVATVPVSGTSASFPDVPSGTYYLRLTASNAAGSSPPSTQVMVTVP